MLLRSTHCHSQPLNKFSTAAAAAAAAYICCWLQESELEELRGTAAHDKMLGRVQHPADAPTRVRAQ
jgi:hypothetical protein